MTFNGWLQIDPVLRSADPAREAVRRLHDARFRRASGLFSRRSAPVERGIYWACGVDEREEQHWVTYAVAMLVFSLAGFVVLYALAAAAGACCRSTRST